MSEPLRILEIVGNAIVGGMETFVARFLKTLRPTAYSVTCVAPFESSFTEALRDIGCTVHTALMPDEPAWTAVQFVASLVRSQGADVIHAHLSNAHALAVLVSALTGVPVVATIHGRTIPILDLEAYRLGRSKLTVVCQPAYQHALLLGADPRDVQLIPNGVPENAFGVTPKGTAMQAQLGLPPTTPLVGFVGRLAPEKRPDVFVRACAQAIAAGVSSHFVLIGDGPLIDELKRLVKTLSVSGRVHFAGSQVNMCEVYASLSMLVSTSDSEGMPLCIMEAMAAGLPVIATAVGGVTDIISNGSTGLLIPPDRPHFCAEAIGTLWKDPDRREAMGVAGQRRAANRFSGRAANDALEQYLQRTARSARSRNAAIPIKPQRSVGERA